jgi:hypothetical protein
MQANDTGLILDELRSLRNDFNRFARDTGSRIAVNEKDLHDLLGNGQPGRMARIEERVDRLMEWRWWLVGAAAGGGGVVSVLGWVITTLKGK